MPIGVRIGYIPFYSDEMLTILVYEALRDAVASLGDGRPERLQAPATAENVLRALAGEVRTARRASQASRQRSPADKQTRLDRDTP